MKIGRCRRTGSGVSRRQNALEPGFHAVSAGPAPLDRSGGERAGELHRTVPRRPDLQLAEREGRYHVRACGTRRPGSAQPETVTPSPTRTANPSTVSGALAPSSSAIPAVPLKTAPEPAPISAPAIRNSARLGADRRTETTSSTRPASREAVPS